MSVESFKTQAERLEQHLAHKHGVKLKKSSILETIAALHGQRDWNNLVALGRGLPEAAMSASVPSPGLIQSVSDLLCEMFERGYDTVYLTQDRGEPPTLWARKCLEFIEITDSPLPVREMISELLVMLGLPALPPLAHFARLPLRSGAATLGAYLEASLKGITVRLVPVRSSVTLRQLQNAPLPYLDELGLSPDLVHAWLEAAQNATHGGLFFVTGPTGSGKSVTIHGTCRTFVKRGVRLAVISGLNEFPVLDGSFNLPETVLNELPSLIGLLKASNIQAVVISETRRYYAQALALAKAGFRVIGEMHAKTSAHVGKVLRSSGVEADDVQRWLKAGLRVYLVAEGSREAPSLERKRMVRKAVAELEVYSEEGGVQRYGLPENLRAVLESGYVTSEQ